MQVSVSESASASASANVRWMWEIWDATALAPRSLCDCDYRKSSESEARAALPSSGQRPPIFFLGEGFI